MNLKISDIAGFHAYAKGGHAPKNAQYSIDKNTKKETFADKKERKILKPAVIISSTLGILGALTLLSQGKKLDGRVGKFLNNAKIGGEHGEHLSEIRNFNMFKLSSYKNLVKNAKYGPLDIITMAGFSIAGGGALGAFLDKKNAKAKLKESISQFVGNIALPVSALTAGAVMAGKTIGKTIFNKNITEQNVKWVKIPMSIAGLAIGMFGGHKIANALNKVLFKEKRTAEEERELSPADLMVHVDDIATTAGMVSKGVPAYQGIARVVPAAIILPGILAGFAEPEN